MFIVNFFHQGKDAFVPKKAWSWPFSDYMYINLLNKKSFVKRYKKHSSFTFKIDGLFFTN